MNFTLIFANIGFAAGALSLGLWTVLGIYWWIRARGMIRVMLVWFAANVVGTLAFRLISQVENLTSNTFPAIDSFRLLLNISTLALGLYLAHHDKVLIERSRIGRHK